MTFPLVVVAAVWVCVCRCGLRAWFRPWIDRRHAEDAAGLPRGALVERWGHVENGISDRHRERLLKAMNRTVDLPAAMIRNGD